MNLYDWRLGLYGLYQQGRHHGYAYVDYGWENNHMQRSIRPLGINLDNTYSGHLLEAGGEYQYDWCTAQTKQEWRVSPYVNFKASYYDQGSSEETGSDIYGQAVDGFTNTYMAMGTGLEVQRKWDKSKNIYLRLGYKHVFSGAAPALNFHYVSDRTSSYRNEDKQDKDFVTLGAGMNWQLGHKWSMDGVCQLEQGAHDNDVRGSVTLKYHW